jgi:Uma2 family endonuclease
VLGPFAVRPNEQTEVQPDILVARAEDLTETHLPVAPVLAIEVSGAGRACRPAGRLSPERG